MLQELIIGTFGHFVEAGTLVGGNPVSKTFKPGSGDPAWEEVGCITQFRPTTESQDFNVSCPRRSGGYATRKKTITTADLLAFDVDKVSPNFWRLLLGFLSPIVNGTAQIPFAETDRMIEGWVQFQYRGDEGADRIVMEVYVELRLVDGTVFDENPVRPVFEAYVLQSDLNTAAPAGVTE